MVFPQAQIPVPSGIFEQAIHEQHDLPVCALPPAPVMPVIVSGDYFYMGSPADHNQSGATETQKEKSAFIG
jgi:hypothetical protein